MKPFATISARILAVLAFCLCATTSLADVVRLEESHPSIRYDGAWQTVNGSAVSGGSVAASRTAGASVTVDFTGSGIAWIGYRSRQAGGLARVFVDGVLQTTVGTHATSAQPQVEIFRINGLAAGAHVLRIEVTGAMQGSDAAGGDDAYVVVDAFEIDDGQSGQLIQESDFSISYSGNWMEVDDPSVSGGSVRASRDVNASAYVTFNGTGIEWIGYRCPCTAGIAQINLLERGFLAYKHTWAPERVAQPVIYSIDGLPPGQHRLEIYVTGDSVAADPANAWVVIDAFRVLNGSGGTGGPEGVAPTVSMTAPASGALVTGVVTLAAEASDNVGVSKVQFFAESNIFLGEDTTAPFSITRDTSQIPSGRDFTLYARALDAAGNVSRSQPIVVTVQHQDRTLPAVAFTEPVAGSTVSGTIALTATATDDFGVAGVTFYRDACCAWSMGPEDTSAPYTRTLDTTLLLDGPHEFFAKARDTAGNFGDATPLAVVVDNSVQPGMRRVDDDDPAITFTGAWSLQGGSDAYGTPLFHWGSAAMSETRGATATFSFTGTGVRWVGYRCSTVCGDATVSIDGGPPQAVSLRGNDEFGAPENVAQVVYTSPVLASGAHTLTITVANDHPSGMGRIYVDAFEVLTN